MAKEKTPPPAGGQNNNNNDKGTPPKKGNQNPNQGNQNARKGGKNTNQGNQSTPAKSLNNMTPIERQEHFFKSNVSNFSSALKNLPFGRSAFIVTEHTALAKAVRDMNGINVGISQVDRQMTLALNQGDFVKSQEITKHKIEIFESIAEIEKAIAKVNAKIEENGYLTPRQQRDKEKADKRLLALPDLLVKAKEKLTADKKDFDAKSKDDGVDPKALKKAENILADSERVFAKLKEESEEAVKKNKDTEKANQ